MRTLVNREVMFLLDRGEGQVVPTETGYGEVSGVTVHLHDGGRVSMTVGVRRCRKDGSDDKRMGNVYTGPKDELPDKDEWIERAKAAV